MESAIGEQNILIIGAGGHARVIADAIMSCEIIRPNIKLAGFVDDDEELKNVEFFGKSVQGKIRDIGKIPHDAIVIGIGDNNIRQELFEMMLSRGERIINVIHPRTIIAKDVKMGCGVVVLAGAIVNSSSQIGDNVILNTASTVDHNCTIGSHVHICPGVHLGGGVSVGDGALLGIGCAIIPNQTIGEWSIVGAGSVVIRKVNAGNTVVGNPTRIIREQSGHISNQKSILRVVSIDTDGEWNAALSGLRDFYHLSFYHHIAQNLNQGVPYLFVYQNGDFRICIPLLIRRIDCLPNSALEGEVFYDATSVYGYAGPILSHPSIPKAVIMDFQVRLTQMLVEMRVVSVFSRLHPLVNQESVLEGLGSIVYQGKTVSIDLSIPEVAQLARYRENHIRGLKKIANAGARCFVDEEFQYIKSFIDIYTETMRRVGATDEYIFPRQYFMKLIETHEAELKLIVCLIESEVICAGVFVKCADVLHYHLGGTAGRWLKLSPMKLVLDTARHWGYEHGAKIFHLGGGVGTRDDSLFQFKLGFSNDQHEFKTWRWILLPSVYDHLVSVNAMGLSNDIECENNPDYFPRYRFNNIRYPKIISKTGSIDRP